MTTDNPNRALSDCFPVWDRLNQTQQRILSENARLRSFPKGFLIHEGGMGCTGLLAVKSGQLRALINSKDGREITIYRLFEQDICLLSASCIIRSVNFDISVEAETDSEIWIVSADVYHRMMDESTALANFTNELMASRFSEVMWLMERILWDSMDKRLAVYLEEQIALQKRETLSVTHEQIARDLGTAREVVTRMLRYFKNEGIVSISRGHITIENPGRLAKLAGND